MFDARRQRLPDRQLQRDQLLGRRRVQHDAAASIRRPPTVVSKAPRAGATGVSTATTVTATFSEAIARRDGQHGQPSSCANAANTLVACHRDLRRGEPDGDAAAQRRARRRRGLHGAAARRRDRSAHQGRGRQRAGRRRRPGASRPPPRQLPVQPVGQRRWSASPTRATRAPSSSASSSVRTWTASSAASATTRAPRTRARTSATCGRRPARSSRRRRFANETATGWQLVLFSAPVAVTANTTYIASVLTPTAGTMRRRRAISSPASTTPPLHAIPNGTSPNGVYQYGASGFPSSSFNATNYWVDLVFNDARRRGYDAADRGQHDARGRRDEREHDGTGDRRPSARRSRRRTVDTGTFVAEGRRPTRWSMGPSPTMSLSRHGDLHAQGGARARARCTVRLAGGLSNPHITRRGRQSPGGGR